jgi:orotate phosphoribosyltransferase
LKEEIAKALLEIGAVEISPREPFHYASGLKGPIYCDNRKLLSHTGARQKIRDAFVELIKKNKLDFDQLAGLATAGIPHASFIADQLNCPMVYIRSKPKAHGKRNQVEGDAGPNQKLLLVEDLVNQGASLEEALLGVKDAGLKAMGCLSIVTYQSEAAENVLKKYDLPLYSLTDFDTICRVARELGRIEEADLELMSVWRKDPKAWSDRHG